jgi:hypothetical protein
MNQNGFLFTAGVTLTQMVPSGGPRGGESFQTWDTCMSAIVFAHDVTSAQKIFENWCQASREGEAPRQIELKKIVGTQLIEQLLTESGNQQLDPSEISRKLSDSVPQTETKAAGEDSTGQGNSTEKEDSVDDLGPGYWVDLEHAVPPDTAHLDMESLKRALPEDIRSALNWSLDKQFIFLVSSLSAPASVNQFDEDFDEENSDDDAELDRTSSESILDEAVSSLPEMRDKEAAALIEARNAVVAAWLWRKFAANTRLASNEILASPCCIIIHET